MSPTILTRCQNCGLFGHRLWYFTQRAMHLISTRQSDFLVKMPHAAKAQPVGTFIVQGRHSYNNFPSNARKYAEKHWYYKLTQPWKSQRQLVQDLYDSILYNDEHVVILNKPNGLPMQALRYNENLPPDVLPPEEEELSVMAVAPLLKEKLQAPDLFEMYSQPRLYSGIVVLAKHEEARLRLKKYFLQARTNKLFVQKYWAVTVGIPSPATDYEQFALKREKISDWILAVKVEKPSTKARQRREVIVPNLGYQTLAVNELLECALVEIKPTATKWDTLQLYLLHKCGPVLGDHVYGSRLKTVLGKPILANPKSCFPEVQSLTKHMNESLNLRKGDHIDIPLHIHCKELVLPLIGAKDKKQTMSVSAPLEQYYERTLLSLNLNPA